jgi:hypothetical protein
MSGLLVKNTKSNKQNKQTMKNGKRNTRTTHTTTTITVPVASAPRSTSYKPVSIIHERGTDRVANYTDVEHAKDSATVVDLMVTPAITSRLQALATQFQQIRYLSMRFRISGKTSSTAAGGFVVGFIKDPADKIPTDSTVPFLIANYGAKSMKWWQSTTFTIPATKWLFTEKPDIGADAPREYSPGRLVIVCDGVAGQAGNITVDLDWDVEMKDPAIRKIVDPPVTFRADLSATFPQGWKMPSSYSGDTTAGQLSGIASTNVSSFITRLEMETAIGVPVKNLDCFKVEGLAVVAQLTKGTVQSDVLCEYILTTGGLFHPAAFNAVLNKVTLPNKVNWAERKSDGTVVYPYDNTTIAVREFIGAFPLYITPCTDSGTPYPRSVWQFLNGPLPNQTQSF